MLAYKFIEKIRKRLEAKKPESEKSEKKTFYTDIIEVCNLETQPILENTEQKQELESDDKVIIAFL